MVKVVSNQTFGVIDHPHHPKRKESLRPPKSAFDSKISRQKIGVFFLATGFCIRKYISA